MGVRYVLLNFKVNVIFNKILQKFIDFGGYLLIYVYFQIDIHVPVYIVKNVDGAVHFIYSHKYNTNSAEDSSHMN